jgi:hypothetical protein
MAYDKPDKKLYEGPVDELCGNPGDRSGGAGVVHGGVEIPGSEHKESGETETVTFYDDLGGAKRA